MNIDQPPDPSNRQQLIGFLAHYWPLLGKAGSEIGQLSLASRISAVTSLLNDDQMKTAAEVITRALDDLTRESRETGTRLSLWTKWLAIGTFALAAATVALVLVEVFKGHGPSGTITP